MTKQKTAIIVCSMDAFANGDKPKKIESFLESHGFSVKLHATSTLTRMGTGKYSKLLPRLTPRAVAAFFFEGLFLTMGGKPSKSAKNIVAFSLAQTLRLRGALLAKQLRGQHYDLLICENNLDEAFFLHRRVGSVQVLDLPAPQAEELYYGGSLTEAGLAKLQKLEKEVYARADRLAFHWHTYDDFVKAKKYDGKNFFDLGYGAPKPTTDKRAEYSKEPRILFFGYLKGYWVNLPLLEKLCELYPNIDIYGGPPPTGPLAKHYKGYAPNTATKSGKDIMADYQFGLITITDDELRRHSFSSKHLDYFAYGLPVLTPAWRQDSKLEAGSIYFTPEDFLEQVKKYSTPKNWREKNAAALKIADDLAWDKVLQPLLTLNTK